MGETNATDSLFTRRKFLKLSGAGLLSASLLPATSFCKTGKPKTGRFSVQLYTVRNDLSKDFQGTLNRIRNIGFSWVETAFWPKGISIEKAAGYIKDAGLKVSG